MNDERPPQMPRVGSEGESCAACHAPLAIDQRYCLQCGHRRGASRVDLAELLVAEGSVARPSPTPAPPAAPPGPWTPLAVVGSIATLGLMLLVGVMIGRDEPPQQIAAVPAATAPVAEAADPSASGGAKDASSGSSVGGGGDAKKVSDAGGGGKARKGGNAAPAGSAPGAETIDEGALDALEGATGQDAADASKNLPDTIALPGKPPPVDNEAPGAGSDAQVIK